ncbi:MAG: DUF3035 domain-containing protein [Pseudomonadota bacterium]
MRSRSLVIIAVAALVGTSACSSGVRQALGAEKTVPDEFRVVTIAPLTVPPEYSLRPPQPGALRAEDIFPDQQARRALFGDLDATSATDGEILFAARAGAGDANPQIRALIDGETAAVVRKDRSFADRVLFWREGESGETEIIPGANAPSEPIDPAAVSDSIEAVTGGGEVEIERRRSIRPKLPGL